MKRQLSFFVKLIVLVLFFNSQSTFAQTYFISASEAYGPLLKIYPNFPHSIGVHNITLGFSTQKKDKLWRAIYKNPITGVYLSYANFGNPTALGIGIGLQYYYRKEQKFTPKFSVYESMLTGMMYYNKPYNAITNPSNIAVGSKTTFLVGIEAGISYQVHQHINIEAGGKFIHGSNSHTDLPNVGINIPTLLIGINYKLEKNKNSNNDFNNISLDSIINRNWKIRPEVGIGFNENGGSVTASDGPIYPIYIIGIGATKRTKKYGKFIALLQGYYNTGYRTSIVSQEDINLENNTINSSVILLSGGYEFLMGRFGFNIMGGYNIHNPYLKQKLNNSEHSTSDRLKSFLAGKFGLNYYIFDPYKPRKYQAFVGFNVKSNLVQADFFETKIGIEF